jgi:hypothetical protein
MEHRVIPVKMDAMVAPVLLVFLVLLVKMD